MKKICLLILLGIGLSLTLLACADTDPTSNGQSVAQIFQTPSGGSQITPSSSSSPVAAPVSNDPQSALTAPPSTNDLAQPGPNTPVVASTPTPVSEGAQTEVEFPPTAVNPTQTTEVPAKPNITPVPGKLTSAPANNLPQTTQARLVPTIRTTTGPTFSPVPTVPAVSYGGALSEVVRGRTGRKQVALTIDAGADGKAFPKIIAALNQYNVHITFFLTGLWVQQNPQFTQQIVANGQEIANHSWDHPDFTKLSDEQARDEIQKTESLLTRFTGRTSRPLWRFPYGARNSHMQQVVNALGYRSVFWSIDSLDSVGQPKTAQFLIDRITKQSDAQLDGEIILMHIGNSTTGDAMPEILRNLKSRGFQIVTVSQLLG